MRVPFIGELKINHKWGGRPEQTLTEAETHTKKNTSSLADVLSVPLFTMYCGGRKCVKVEAQPKEKYSGLHRQSQ